MSAQRPRRPSSTPRKRSIEPYEERLWRWAAASRSRRSPAIFRCETIPDRPTCSGRTFVTYSENRAVVYYPHAGGSADAGDLSQLIPVLHPMMTGARGAHHQIDWSIADKEAGYVKPAQSLAMMAVELLHDDARQARDVLSQFVLGMTKQAYFEQQQGVFVTERFDGNAVESRGEFLTSAIH